MKIPTTKQFFSLFDAVPASFSTITLAFVALISTRVFSEYFMEGFSVQNPQFLWYEWTHTLLFFAVAYGLFFLLIRWFFCSTTHQTSVFLLFGFLITLVPSIIDHFFPIQGKFYDITGLIGQFFTVYGILTPNVAPHITVTYGAIIEILIVTLGLSALGFLKRRKITDVVFLGLTAYSIFFVLGTLSSILTIFFLGFTKGFALVNATDTAKLFLSPGNFLSYSVPDLIGSFHAKMSFVYSTILLFLGTITCFMLYPKHTHAIIRNSRFPQLIYHAGLYFLGMAIALVFTRGILPNDMFDLLVIFLLLVAIFFAWMASVTTNDLFDQNIDRVTNTNRPLVRAVFTKQSYAMLGITFFILSLFLAALVNIMCFVFLFGYQVIAWIYSAWPLRLKRFPFLATLMSAFASIMILFLGFFLVSSETSLERVPWQIYVFLLFAYTLSLGVKDLKDVSGDKNEGVFTLPVLFGDYWSRIILGTLIFFSYLVSVVILHEYSLWSWAFVFGGLSFFACTSKYMGTRFIPSDRSLPLIVLSLVVCYGFLVVLIGVRG